MQVVVVVDGEEFGQSFSIIKSGFECWVLKMGESKINSSLCRVYLR